MVHFTDFSTLAAQLSVIAFMVGVLTETIKAFAKDKVFALSGRALFFVALFVGVASAVLLKISLFETSNQVIFYVGCILAGAIGSRGANRIHDVLDVLGSLRK